MLAGLRYDLTLTVVSRSSYQSELHGQERTVTKYRYVFHDEAGTSYVYSGIWLHNVNPGLTFKIRATCKQWEATYKQWRLKRPEILRQIKEGETFDFD